MRRSRVNGAVTAVASCRELLGTSNADRQHVLLLLLLMPLAVALLPVGASP